MKKNISAQRFFSHKSREILFPLLLRKSTPSQLKKKTSIGENLSQPLCTTFPQTHENVATKCVRSFFMLLLRMTLRILMTRETPCFFPAAFFDKHHKSPNVSHTERKKKRNPPRFTLKFFLFSLYLLFTRAKSKSVSQFEKNYPKSRPPDCVSKERKGRERKKNFSRNSISRKKTLEITFKIEAAKTVGNQNL